MNLNQTPHNNEEDEHNVAICKAIFENPILEEFTFVRKAVATAHQTRYLDLEYDNITKSEYEKPFEMSPGVEYSEPFAIKVVQKCKNVELQNKTVSTSMSRESISNLKDYGIDAIDMVENRMINEAQHSVIKDALSQIDKYSEQAYMETWTKKDHRKKRRSDWISKYMPFLRKWFPKFFKIFKKEYVLEGINTQEVMRKLISLILSKSNMIAAKSRIGPATAIIVNGQIGSILQDSSMFTPVNTNSISSGGFPYIIGNFSGIKVIIDPNKRWDDLTVNVFRKPNDDQQGINTVYLPKATSLQIIAETNFTPKAYLNTRYVTFFNGEESKASNHFQKIYLNFNSAII